MSSDEFEYESDDEMFQEEEEEGDDEAIQIENTFYEADDNKATQPEIALEQFCKVVELEAKRGSEVVWRFKALQNVVMLSGRLNRFDEMARRYQELLAHMDKVSRNDASEAINTILDAVPQTSDRAGVASLEKLYESTLEALKSTNNQRLWFNVSVKLAKVYLELGETHKLIKMIRELHKTCQTADGSDDVSKASLLLEIYALEIQMCTQTKNSARMKEIYPKTINLSSAIVDPRNVAVIRESAGRMFMTEKKWEEAYNEFWESFKNYQETGNAGAKVVLKYVVLSSMLALSGINPFDSREAKVYQEDPEINAMAQLRTAYETNDIQTVDKLLTGPQAYRILSDPFIKTYLDDLLQKIRLQVLQSVIAPYRCVALSFLAQELNIEQREVVELVVKLILDNTIKAHIDGTQGFLQVDEDGGSNDAQFEQCQKWVEGLEKLQNNLCSRLAFMHP
jgi:COP9 signalosome complex subunit 2